MSCQFYGQPLQKIRFKKDSPLIFFQKDRNSDTLYRKDEQVFYLLVSDALKKSLSIEVENGQMISALSDSLVKINYLPGFKYESLFILSESSKTKGTLPEYEFKTRIDGTSVLTQTKISVSFINKATGGLILQNVFFYKN